MPFQIVRNDLTRVHADALVNTANPRPVIGGGTERALYLAAGPEELLAAREAIGPITPGHAAYTGAFSLHAKYLIHTVGPVWIDGSHHEREILRSCYASSLSLASRLLCQSIAFPLIASGTYGFPKDEALDIAIGEIRKFLEDHEMKVILVVFDKDSFVLSTKITQDIDSLIDDAYSVRQIRAEFSESKSRRILRQIPPEPALPIESQAVEPPINPKASAAAMPRLERSLDKMIKDREESFQRRLFRLIDERGLEDVTVYKKANIDRKVFSHIRCNPDYRPKKNTALALAIALELDLSTTRDLLSRAGIALSPSSPFDIIITYFIREKNYDIMEINAALFKYDQPALGY